MTGRPDHPGRPADVGRRDLRREVPHDGALLAPAALQAKVRQRLMQTGLGRHRATQAVVPRREPGRHNVVLDHRQDRWVADCPECPGAEVVPASGPFICGSCGAEADVDWEDS